MTNKIAWTFVLVLTGFLFALIISAPAHPVYSQSGGTPLTGYAWSDTIGWIDLNCENQGGSNCVTWGLTADSNGNLSGDAWSDSIGWVSANSADLSGCPSAPCTAKISGGALTGWLKALAANGNGWDGWISLSGSGYGPALSGNSFSGYAWGSNVVGWVDFEYAHYGSCTPTYSCSGNTIQYTNSACQTTNVTTCVLPQFCSTGSSICLYPTISTNLSSGKYLQITPNLVRAGNTVQLSWNISGAQSCTVSGSNGDGSSQSTDTHSPGVWNASSASETSSPINTQTTYTLTCTPYGSNPGLTDAESVSVTPVFKEK